MRRTFLLLLVGFGFTACPSFAQAVRIGVFGLFHPRTLVLRPERGTLVLFAIEGKSLVLSEGHETEIHLESDSLSLRVAGQKHTAAGLLARGSSGKAARFALAVPGKIVRVFEGRLEVRAGPGELIAIVVMDREVAVRAVVAAESPPGAPFEALKAQAVVARSYYAAGPRRHADFDFCDTTHCQFLREPPASNSPAGRATTETRGLVLHFENSLFPTLFSASCGGRTRSLTEAGMAPDGYPYFPVACAPCLLRAQSWTRRVDDSQAARLLRGEKSERARLEIGRELGWSTVPGNNYILKPDGAGARLEGRGAGHGVGLCQLGAAVMAQEGSKFQEILSHYFPNTILGLDTN